MLESRARRTLLIRKLVLFALGFVFVALAIVGVVTPILPASPFVVFAIACFARASDRFHRWLMSQEMLNDLMIKLRGADSRILNFTAKLLDWALAI